MPSVPHNRGSDLVSTTLSVATVAFTVAGAATDAVPIVKQILNCTAQISAAAEKIQKRREAMYLLVEKADIYAKQIDIAVAGCVIDASLQRRLGRLYGLFQQIETLVADSVGPKSPVLMRIWRNMIIKPKRAEALLAELEQELQLFHLTTEIQLSADIKYDGQFRRLRDCDVERLDVIHQRETDKGIIVWSAARIDGQLMVVRHLNTLIAQGSEPVIPSRLRRQSVSASSAEFLKNIERVSTISGSHRHVAQLYGRHIQRPDAVVFRSGTTHLRWYLWNMSADQIDLGEVKVKRLQLAYKILDASCYLEDVHGLAWIGTAATVDENGEPRIGLFDDIVEADTDHGHISPEVYFDILYSFHCLHSHKMGVVETVHDSFLHTVVTEHLREGIDVDCLQRVWDIIRQQYLFVRCDWNGFPISHRNSRSQEMIARAQRYFNAMTEGGETAQWLPLVRHLLAGSGNLYRISIFFRRSEEHWQYEHDYYTIKVEMCVGRSNDIEHIWLSIDLPPSEHLLKVAVVRALGLPDDFETSWDGLPVIIYEEEWEGVDNYECNDAWDERVYSEHEEGGEDDDLCETAEEGNGTEDKEDV